MAALITFISVFLIWSLSLIAGELEQPFGTDEDDVNLEAMQQAINARLLVLISPAATHVPVLKPSASRSHAALVRKNLQGLIQGKAKETSLNAAWKDSSKIEWVASQTGFDTADGESQKFGMLFITRSKTAGLNSIALPQLLGDVRNPGVSNRKGLDVVAEQIAAALSSTKPEVPSDSGGKEISDELAIAIDLEQGLSVQPNCRAPPAASKVSPNDYPAQATSRDGQVLWRPQWESQP
eukprot:gnl/TRDRNA2_/TRDRNA2_142803_c1_seq1.p1 gnl/TRDRNA2_/TRDRNA2_142803_c1~~gnl/TRDRNA2_/TRDRNA2_142803_c1_seq1.p1  ORF type:complete len:269 (-),score=39.87 gnl/TRDRNA2_/TRDRNA2_142803_c1_seq1:62-775(-)